ncbi:Arc family DNA-binding protein [Neorhizobium huautlense]|uniref:Arc family DNA-binding protein n=1 Tax=Neorhizobium huautlense TaxID=67774 RepID=UPI002477F530|nr:Arc family DNA-binding protein [Neorhizobium huautlense]
MQPQDKYVLRLPDGMRDLIREAAAQNKRSMNAEIIDTLERTYRKLPPGHYRSNLLSDAEKEEIWEWLQERAKADSKEAKASK